MSEVENALAIVETISAVELFAPGFIDPIIDRIAVEVREQANTLDISTPNSRSQLAALAYKVARSKTFIDGQRKTLVSDEKKRLAKIDAEGKRIWDTLESLQLEVRKPLTDWEDAEKERVADHEYALKTVESLASTAVLSSTSGIDSLIISVKSYQDRDWQEFSKRAEDTINSVLHQLYNLADEAKRREVEAEELAKLRKEARDREQKEQFERTVREATENAERSRIAAEERARVAEEQRKADAVRHEARLVEEAKRATQLERERADITERRTRAEAEAREADKENRKNKNSDALAAFVKAGLTHEAAKLAVQAIVKGDIPGVRMVY